MTWLVPSSHQEKVEKREKGCKSVDGAAFQAIVTLAHAFIDVGKAIETSCHGEMDKRLTQSFFWQSRPNRRRLRQVLDASNQTF
jgi:hypothetical protein